MLTTLTAALMLATGPAADAAEPAKVEPPSIKLQSVTPKGMLLFEVTNPNAAPPLYFGYTANSFTPPLKEGTIFPLYNVELLRGKEWKPKEMGWCGTGVGPVTLPAKGKVTFEVLQPGGEWDEFRVGVLWFAKQDMKGEAGISWSPLISRKDAEGKKP